jgi:hypothetical protein
LGSLSPSAGHIRPAIHGKNHLAFGPAALRREAALSPDESDREVERLRGEVSELKAQLAAVHAEVDAQATAAREARAQQIPGATRARRRIGWRGPVASLLIVVGCLLAPLSVLAVWTATQISNTDSYVANVSPLITDPAVRNALTDKASKAITEQIDVQSLTKQAAAQLDNRGLTRLGSLLSSASGPIASGVNSFIHSSVAKIVASPQVQKLWVQGNRIVHEQLVLALEGKKSAITVSNGQVVVGLGPITDQVKHNLAARGLTIVNKLPPINPTFALFSAKYLVTAQSLYRLLNALRWVLPILAFICLAAGVYIARRHRRALVGAGLGLAASMVVLGALLAIGRTVYLNSLPASSSADAAAAAFDILVRFIEQGLRVLFVVGLVVALTGFFTGPSVTAVRTRNAFKSGFAAIRRTGERAGLTTGRVGSWVYRYRTALRITAVAVAALVVVFWSALTALTVLVVVLVLLAILGLIELVSRPQARPNPAGTAHRGPPA